jgi:hypothetical protein
VPLGNIETGFKLFDAPMPCTNRQLCKSAQTVKFQREKMRSNEQIAAIKKTHSPPVQLLNALDTNKIEFLLNYYHSRDKIEKNTGPKVVYVDKKELV